MKTDHWKLWTCMLAVAAVATVGHGERWNRGPSAPWGPSAPFPQAPAWPSATNRPSTAGSRMDAPSGMRTTSAGGAQRETTYNLPALWVSGGGTIGGCSRNVFRFRRDGAGGALRISASDDTPGGSGRASRASLWQAAMTAAMLKEDPMSGVRIEYEYSGMVDGPSAGGVFCLAVMSALDGRTFPDDFAMTGTIMPDGTIGAVGGVAHKLRGAKKAGIRRVCIPAVLRFESESDGSVVDLVAEARRLGLELHPVNNVEEAYAILHKLPAPSVEQMSDSEIYTEPEPQEKALFGTLLEVCKSTKECKEALAELMDDEDVSGAMETVAGMMLNHYQIPDWEVPMKAGMLHVAFQLAADELAIWRGVIRLAERLGSVLGTYDLDTTQGYARWEQDLQHNIASVKGGIADLERNWLADTGREGRNGVLKAQCVSVNWFSEVNNFNIRTQMEVPSQAEIDADEDERFVARELAKEAVCAHHEIFFETVDAGWQAIAATLPTMRAKSDPRRVEALFHAAQNALSESLDESYGRIARGLVEDYFDWSLYELKKQEAAEYHEQAVLLDSEGRAGADFAMVMSAMAQADALAHGFMAQTMVSPEIGWHMDDDGQAGYKNQFFVSYLLRTARVQAVRALSACVKGNIPCPRVRYHIERGDFYRDDDGFDRFDVLREYWCAMLQAKVLRMLY